MRSSILAGVAAAVLALAAPAALAGNGTTTTTTTGAHAAGPKAGKCQGQTAPSVDTSQVQADIAKLDTDIQTRHKTLDADIQALTTDAQNGVASDTLKTDRAKIQSDFQANETVVQQDRARVAADAKALIQSIHEGCGARKAAHDQLETLRKSAAQAIQAEIVQFKQENQQLHDAAKAALQQDHQQHHQAKHPKGSGQPGQSAATTTTGNG